MPNIKLCGGLLLTFSIVVYYTSGSYVNVAGISSYVFV